MKNAFRYQLNPLDLDEMFVYIHLNDLVTNWEEEEISFIEALCKAISLTDIDATSKLLILETTNIELATRRIRGKWNYVTTSKRLEFLFNIFNHLLK